MVIGFALLAGIVVAWALGARLQRLADMRFRGDALVFAALGIQVAIFTPLDSHVPAVLDRPLHVGSYLLVLGFFALNMRVPGFWLVGFGVLSNVVVIFANGGRMPVTLAAWTASGSDPSLITRTGVNYNNVLVGPHTRLGFLGDVFALPPSVPFATAVSIGDILMLMGMVAFVYRACADRDARPRAGVLAPLRSPAFRRVIAGRFVSSVGDWLTQVAAVTWIYSNTRSTFYVGAFLIAIILSNPLGSLASAPLLDRMRGFRVLAGVEALRGLTCAAMIPFALTGQVWGVIVLAGISAFLGAATHPSAAALLPEALPPDLLQAGNALHQLSRSVTSIGGSIAGAFLVIRFGIVTALVIDFATFVVAVILYLRYVDSDASQQRGDPAATPSRRHLLATVLRSRVVFGLTASFTVATAAWGLINSVFSQFFDERLHEPHAYGFVVAVVGVGYLFGESLTGMMRRQSVARRSVSLAFLASAGILYALSHASIATTAFLLLFTLGAADGITEVVHDTLMQLHAPRELRAGVFAVSGAIERTGMLIGVASAAVVVNATSPAAAVRLGAAALVASAAVAGVALIGGRLASDDLVPPVGGPTPAAAELEVVVHEIGLGAAADRS